MTAEQVNQFFSFLYAGSIGTITFWLRLLAGVLTSAFLGVLVVVYIKFRELFAGGTPAPSAAEDAAAKAEIVAQPWQEVLTRLESASPADWNLAVVRADAILDEVLKDMGLAGTTMGERLKQLDRAKLASLDDVWEAHKTRNRIVHETDRVLTQPEARRAVELYGRALRELDYLQE